MLFRVIAGKHVDKNLRVYLAGDQVESETDLTSIFAEKFKRDLDAEAEQARRSPATADTDAEDDEPAPKKKLKKKMRT